MGPPEGSRTSVKAVVGIQFGDEGKGKISDFLAAESTWVVRYQGGPNTGHTIVAEGEKFVLHQVASGILHAGCNAVSGPGMVIAPSDLLRELHELESKHLARGRLYLSDRAHVILPWHRIQDAWEEEMRGSHPGGTTLRGIGPAYEDRVGRWGIRMGDLGRPELLREKLERLYRVKSHMNGPGRELPPIDVVAEELARAQAELAPYITTTEPLLWDAVELGENILLEGAQSTMLDVDYGTYPFVTSSHSIVGGAFIGSGLSPRPLDEIVGVTKAYCTRVGNGPFPTELFDSAGERLRERGGERGATTGRPRRCGWLDLVMLRYAARINGLTSLAVTKADALGGEDEVKVCVRYLGANGKEYRDFPPAIAEDLEKVTPVYESLPGWGEFTPALRARIKEDGWSALPREMTRFLEFIPRETGVAISLVGYGPGRDEVVGFPPSLPRVSTLTEWTGKTW